MLHHPAPDGFWHLVRAARDLRRALDRAGLPPGDEVARMPAPRNQKPGAKKPAMAQPIMTSALSGRTPSRGTSGPAQNAAER